MVSNFVVLIGDIYINWVNELCVDDCEIDCLIVVIEFVIILFFSGGNGVDKLWNLDVLFLVNLCVKFYNVERGYICCDVIFECW